MEIEVRSHQERPVPAELVRRLYDDMGWWPERSEVEIKSILTEAIAIGAWHGDELVGFARAVTDGRFRAYIEDVMVQRHFRRQEIGMRLLARLLDELGHIDTISLFCEPSLIEFYQRLGFRSSGQVVLHRR